MIRVVIINPEEEPVTEETVPDGLKTWQDIVGGYIEAVYVAPKGLLYVNENGLYKDSPSFFTLEGAGSGKLAGNGVLLSYNAEGDSKDCIWTLEDVISRVEFVT